MDSKAPLAIVGYAYRAPGVGRKGLWEFLADAKSAWSQVPPDRFRQEAFYQPSTKPGFYNSQGGHFLPEDIYAFDASFFNIKADEARSLDPQTRLVLECAFEAVESAGLTLPGLAGTNVGVFAQTSFSDYSTRLTEDLQTSNKYAALGLSPALVANRLSYFLGVTGPSMSVDAACAGSTYAIHQACQSIRAGECSAAIIGAANIISGPEMWIALAAIGALSPEGKSFAYDSKASGFGRGEGGGCLIIKPLSDAIACGDPVRAVIRSSVCNHSGRTQGITMPSQTAQEQLLTSLHESVGLDAVDTTFVEGHGTGTKAGDPIDAGAITAVIAKVKGHRDTTYIGSAKSNFGHLEGASGFLSVVKAIMMLEQQYLLPNANFEEFNPEIANDGRLTVLTEPLPWPLKCKRRVCITNFGFGGSNSAVLLERAVPPEASISSAPVVNGISSKAKQPIVNGGTPRNITELNVHTPTTVPGDRLFVLSAGSSASLTAYASCLEAYLEGQPTSLGFFKALSFTLGQRRTHFPRHRRAIVANSMASLRNQLATAASPSLGANRYGGNIAFIFTGQSAQYFQMASGLENYHAFSGAIKRADSFLTELGAPWSLQDELAKPQSKSRVDSAEISQPACTAVQLGLVALLQSWGVTPAIVVGHSSGEIAAAYAAKFISFEAAIAIAYFRGVAVNEVVSYGLEQGAMLALGVSADEATNLIELEDGYATIAAINSPNSVTISGDIEAIENIQEKCQDQDIFARRLKVDVAYHSRHMESSAASYFASIEPFCLSSQQSPEQELSPKPAFISSVSGKQEPSGVVDQASYWVQNLVGTVQFLKALETLHSSSFHGANAQEARPILAVEIGPHSALKVPTIQTMDLLGTKNTHGKPAVSYCPSLLREKAALTSMLDLAGKLFVAGHDISFGEVNKTPSLGAKVLTDLPPYEWNKSTRYIHQSRISAQKLLGGGPYHPLLGCKSPYSEGNEHVYRNVFTLDDIPWIRDHNIAGEVLFPFTAFFSLAVGAFRELHQTAPVPNVLVKEFHVMRSLNIKEDEQVDITTKLRPADMGTDLTSTSVWSFEILSWSSSHGWIVHCRGSVEKDLGETFEESPTVRASRVILEETGSRMLDHQKEYTFLAQNGVLYGPSFRVAVEMRQLPGAIIHKIKLRDIGASGLEGTSPVTVDPPTLDSFYHAIGIIQERDGPRPVQVPTDTRRWRISNRITADAGHELTVVSKKLSHDVKSGNLHLSIVVFDLSSGFPQPVMEIDDLALKTIVPLSNDRLLHGLPKTYFMRYTPYVDLVDGSALAKTIMLPTASTDELQNVRDTEKVSVHFLSRMLDSVKTSDGNLELPPHLSKLLAWAYRLVARHPAPGLSPGCDDQLLIHKVSSMNAAGEMVCKVGEVLPEIIRGEIEPLEIMLEDSLLTRYYEQDMATKRANMALAEYCGLVFDCKPNIRILEIGAGTGSATLPVLEAMERKLAGRRGTFHYTFTDISAGFFENARTKLSRWSKYITFKKLDIGEEPLAQGFATEDYDLVIASNVLHATPNIEKTIGHTRALLRPGGNLALLELTKTSLPLIFPFASLKGWWLSEDNHRSIDGPLLTKPSWHTLLESTGFSGLDGYVEDYPGEPEQFASVMWSTKLARPSTTMGPIRICPVSTTSPDTALFANEVDRRLGQLSEVESSISLLPDLVVDATTLCIFVDDPQHSIFSDLSQETFSLLQQSLLEARHVLWVIPAHSHPDTAFAKGFLRTLRLEDDSKSFVLLDNAALDRTGVEVVSKLAGRLCDPETLHEQEYCMIGDVLHVPRLHPHKPADETFAIQAGVTVKENRNVWNEEEEALEMTLDAVGSPDSIFFRDTSSEVFHQPLAGEEIVIKVSAIGINFRDLLLVLGSLPWHAPGFEGAGVVVRAGKDVKDLQVGDRVFYAINQSGITNYVRTSSARASKLPGDLALADAASMPIAYCTALASLVDTAQIRKGETVLIHAATGAVGQACIMLSQHLGAVIFATAGTHEKREFLTKTYGIPADHIFSSRNSEFSRGILLATNDRGVDVVVNSLSGHLLQQSWELIAPHGRFVELGKKDLFQNNHLSMRPFLQNVSFHSLDVRMIESVRPGAMRGWLSDIISLYKHGAIKPIQPVTQIPISQLATSLRKLQSGQNVGKIVLTLGPDEKVLTAKRSPLDVIRPPGALLSPDATYIITGGTGGIGRSLASWVAKQGAKHIVLLGRSGPSSPKVAELLTRYEGTDVCMRAIACDVGSHNGLTRAKEAIENMPRVRGVVHGALYLHDAMFLNSTFEDYQNITLPKIKSAWMLHDMFPNLDFFVSLSSLDAIIGHFGQSLYAGTSTFLDAFSEYRIRHGQPAVSISLPVVEGVGYVADRGISDRLKGSLGLSIDEEQLHTLVKGAIIGPSSGLNVNGSSFSFVTTSTPGKLPWEDFNPLRAMRLHQEGLDENYKGRTAEVETNGSRLVDASPEALMEALRTKVSTVTMMDREEVTAERSLSHYGLDSLVSVELRNWIRREYGAELALKDIVVSRNLNALSMDILSQIT
ncbi:Compactin diketide synthase [Apiospora sp. TS-2023a]